MALLPIIALVVGGLFLVSKSSEPTKSVKSFDGMEIPMPSDKGYTIVVPCQIYDVYNEEASYQYAYHEFSKMLPSLAEALKKNDPSKLADVIDIFQSKIYDCKKGEENTIFKSPKYYSWAYRILRSGMRAIVDKRKLAGNITKQEAIQKVNQILEAYRQMLVEQGLDVQGLPITVEGDFIQ
jgi:hypothetical protein